MNFIFNPDWWETASFVVTVVALPFAIFLFLFEQRKERDSEDEEAYQLLQNAYNDFLKIVLDNPDLQLRSATAQLDLTSEQRERQLIVFEMLISLFERAYIVSYEPELKGVALRRWLALAQGFAALPTDEQARLHDRMTEWASLSAQQRNQARLNFAVTHRMAPEDRRTQWDAYQALSEEDKRKLAARAAQKPQGAAPALRPVSPKKLAKVPAAINAPGNPANPPKVAPAPGATARIAAPGGLPPESRPAATAENTGVAPAALLPAASAPAPSASASTSAPSDAPAEAQPANLYLN